METRSSSIGPSEHIVELAGVLRDYRPQVYRFLLASFGDHRLARNLTQRWLEEACLGWRPSRDNSRIRLWLMRIAVHLEKRYWRKQQLCFWRKTKASTLGLALLDDQLPAYEQPFADRIQAKTQIRKIWNAVCQMSNPQRIVFLLHCVEDMDFCEIADAADLRESTVKALLSEAMDSVRATLN